MQSGRISPVFRQFFQGVTGGKSATDSQSGNKQGQKQEPDREPNREDSLEALDLLTQEEEFQKNALKAELREIEGKFCISVMNSMGAQLRKIGRAHV